MTKKTKTGAKQVGNTFPNPKTQFQKGESGNPNGRPKKLISKLKAQGYKQSEINDCIKVMLSMTREQIDSITKNKNATALEMMVAAAIDKAIKSGNLSTFETLVSRSFGKPKETIEIRTVPIEIEAAKSLFQQYVDDGLTERVAINRVVKGARQNGFEITKEDILNADIIK